MTIEFGAIIAALTAVITGGVAFGWIQRQVANSASEIDEIWGQIRESRKWRELHDKDVAEKRVEFERQISLLRENAIGKDGKLDVIISRLDTIDRKIDKLEDREERERNDKRD